MNQYWGGPFFDDDGKAPVQHNPLSSVVLNKSRHRSNLPSRSD
jgi:hypothetical protein